MTPTHVLYLEGLRVTETVMATPVSDKVRVQGAYQVGVELGLAIAFELPDVGRLLLDSIDANIHHHDPQAVEHERAETLALYREAIR
jgi:hypothetical protein